MALVAVNERGYNLRAALGRSSEDPDETDPLPDRSVACPNPICHAQNGRPFAVFV